MPQDPSEHPEGNVAGTTEQVMWGAQLPQSTCECPQPGRASSVVEAPQKARSRRTGNGPRRGEVANPPAKVGGIRGTP